MERTVSQASMQVGRVTENRVLCREHLRLTFRVPDFADAGPGQFVHVRPANGAPIGYRLRDGVASSADEAWVHTVTSPMLRRAFSIARLKRADAGAEIAIIYRVVGTATRWLASLAPGDAISVLGPLGNRFPVSETKPRAWMVAGGVGLPPMLWLAGAVASADRDAVAFCGAQTKDLFALELHAGVRPSTDAAEATLSSAEFARHHIPMVLSTDDGSLGYCGYVGAAVRAYHERNPVPASELVIYTCGPEAMMRSVAEYCVTRGIECYVCMERAMACGTGLCQSCVVPVSDADDADGWRYRLCCSDGPVFEARDIIWEPAGLI